MWLNHGFLSGVHLQCPLDWWCSMPQEVGLRLTIHLVNLCVPYLLIYCYMWHLNWSNIVKGIKLFIVLKSTTGRLHTEYSIPCLSSDQGGALRPASSRAKPHSCAQILISIFDVTHSCESLYSTVKFIKSKYRSVLTDEHLSEPVRTALSK
jgi:hypothetical protein